MIRALPLALLLAAGCAAAPAPPAAGPRAGGPEVLRGAAAPADAPAGTCWVRDLRPAVVETVVERVALPPATAGGPPLWRSETRQRILRPREELLFEAVCPEALEAGFVASLQRALRVRGFLEGPVTGALDAPTRAAIRRFQAPRGLDSAVLSVAAARALGLVAVALAPA
ncbi:MAG: peptidoglycan-binding protein [Rhodobacteraceae bacterium]|nr:peptidoglycan-binding protein [Paracoccaceae bacterium]